MLSTTTSRIIVVAIRDKTHQVEHNSTQVILYYNTYYLAAHFMSFHELVVLYYWDIFVYLKCTTSSVRLYKLTFF